MFNNKKTKLTLLASTPSQDNYVLIVKKMLLLLDNVFVLS